MARPSAWMEGKLSSFSDHIHLTIMLLRAPRLLKTFVIFLRWWWHKQLPLYASSLSDWLDEDIKTLAWISLLEKCLNEDKIDRSTSLWTWLLKDSHPSNYVMIIIVRTRNLFIGNDVCPCDGQNLKICLFFFNLFVHEISWSEFK